MRKNIFLLGFSIVVFFAQAQKVPLPVLPVSASENSEYMETVQKATFRYFWDFAHPVSGMAPERSATPNVVTSGGTGFGLMATVVGTHRGWIKRQEAVKRLLTLTSFLGKADRFHGAWSHWLDGRNGRMVPFGVNDNGGDIIETAFLVNGLLVVRSYFDGKNPEEVKLRDQITKLWESVEWDWYASRGDGLFYWHWSADKGWIMNMPVRGYNECLIAYVLALGSPTHPIKAEVYENTWKKSDFYHNGNSYLGFPLSIGFPYGGPLFFTHYSYLSLDPRLMADQKTNYWQHNLAQSLINYTYCVKEAPEEYGYSTENWGLTASDDYHFYDAHSPTNDNGTISPTAALSSFPYTPAQSLRAMRYLYLKKGNRLFGDYGFYDAYNETKNWYSNQYLAIDQGPVVVMMENYRSQLIWKIGRNIPELWNGLRKMGITTPEYPTGFYMYIPDPDTKETELLQHPDHGKYLLDFAVKGDEPISIVLKNAKGETKTIADGIKVKGMQMVSFSADPGKYEISISQGTKTETMKFILRR